MLHDRAVALLLLLACACAPTGNAHAQVPTVIYRYNLSYATTLAMDDAYEHTLLLGTLSGLVNRDTPRLFVSWTDADTYWLQFLTRPGQWLANATFVDIPTGNLSALVTPFLGQLQGVVLFDPHVPATSNVASTVAGVDGLLPVCFRPNTSSIHSPSTHSSTHSVYDQLVGASEPNIMNENGAFAPSGFDVCFDIGTRHLWLLGVPTVPTKTRLEFRFCSKEVFLTPFSVVFSCCVFLGFFCFLFMVGVSGQRPHGGHVVGR